jgi:glycosyltransferase involved in cell wall biosynthesis
VQGDLHDAVELLNMASARAAEHSYDAVLLYEVFEHVPDTEATLDVMESLLAPGGRVYLTTPNGAFERGQIDGWSSIERKGHLRAIPATQFSEQLIERGKVEDFRVHHEGRLTFASYTPRTPLSRISFYAGGSFESWSPAQIRQADEEGRVGLGGSETALVQVATRLAARGHRVIVYSGADEGLFGGVLYRPFTAWDPTREDDLLIVSRLAHVFDNPIGAKRTALWCHDHSYPGQLTEERVEKIDAIIVLSEWQHERFTRLYPFAEERLVLIRNGIQFFEADGTERYAQGAQPFGKRKPRVVYSSSADRGLDVLLDMWPRIKERVPKAELHVYYGFDVLERIAFAHHDPNLIAFKTHVLGQVAALGAEEGGVFLHGRTGQQELADDMMKSRVLGYPTAFMETSCITAMEARAAGLAIVTSDLGALAETVGDHGTLVPWVNADGEAEEEFPVTRQPAYQEAFVNAVCGALTNGKAWRQLHVRAVTNARENDWDERIDEWEALALVALPEEVSA